jgi:hypothetical protein
MTFAHEMKQLLLSQQCLISKCSQWFTENLTSDNKGLDGRISTIPFGWAHQILRYQIQPTDDPHEYYDTSVHCTTAGGWCAVSPKDYIYCSGLNTNQQ